MKKGSVEDRLEVLIEAGKYLAHLSTQNEDECEILKKTRIGNGWFTEEQLQFACREWGRALDESKVRLWASKYELNDDQPKASVGIVMAGNIPLAGLHDLLTVWLCGQKAVVKLSSQDNVLIPALSTHLIELFPFLSSRLEFSERISGCDFYIATGSGNSTRYFREFFGKYPNLIRGHRNSVAILSGEEDKETLDRLGEDMFTYFGLGCRSVSKIFVPYGYDPDHFFKGIYGWNHVGDHRKYYSNFEYYRAIYLLNREDILENGFLLYRKDDGYASPPAVLYWEPYQDLENLKERLQKDADLLQCVVAGEHLQLDGTITPGLAQHPELWDYADQIDTAERLIAFINK